MTNIQMQIIDENTLCDQLTPENMELYLSGDAQVKLLEKVVVKPFETALKEMTGYDADNIPDGKEIVEKRVGNHVIKVEVKPTSSTSYGNVYEAMVNFMNGLREGFDNGRKRSGVRMVENEPFTLIDDVVDKLDQEMRYNTSRGVNQTIGTSAGKDSMETSLKTAYVDITDDFSEVRGGNATIYIEATKQIERINRRIIKPFVKEVKKTIGFDKDNLPDDVEYTKIVVGDVLIHAVSSKADSISYAPIVDELQAYVSAFYGELFDSARSSCPEFRRFDGNGFIGIDSVLGKAAEYKGEHTKASLRQSIDYLRLPRPDKVIAVR